MRDKVAHVNRGAPFEQETMRHFYTSFRSGRVRRLLTFVLVGAVSSAFYLATMAAMVEFARWTVPSAALAAFAVGTLVSYVGNTHLTFGVSMNRRIFARFLLITGIGMASNQAIAVGLDRVGAHYVIISAVVFVLVPACNYLGHVSFTYRDRAR